MILILSYRVGISNTGGRQIEVIKKLAAVCTFVHKVNHITVQILCNKSSFGQELQCALDYTFFLLIFLAVESGSVSLLTTSLPAGLFAFSKGSLDLSNGFCQNTFFTLLTQSNSLIFFEWDSSTDSLFL